VIAGYVELPSVRTWYDEHGEGEPLVMLHGGVFDARFFDQNRRGSSTRTSTRSRSGFTYSRLTPWGVLIRIGPQHKGHDRDFEPPARAETASGERAHVPDRPLAKAASTEMRFACPRPALRPIRLTARQASHECCGPLSRFLQRGV
jgi:hypothetical protein